MKKEIMIVGGGIAGLLASYLLSKNKKYTIHLIEKSNSLGGLLKSFDYGKYGKFDYGAHNILETGIKELDKLLIDLLKPDEWQVSSAINGQKRALTGVFFNSKVQQHTPYIDLREKKDIDELKIDFLTNFEKQKNTDTTTAYNYSKSIFGEKITTRYIEKIFKSIYGVSSKKMDYMSMFLTPLTRVTLFDKNTMNDILNTSKLSKNLAYPNQKTLDSKYFGTKKTYYPINYGIYRVIDKLEEKLKKNNVKIHLNTEVTDIKLKDKKIIKVNTNEKSFSNIEHLFYSAGLLSLEKLLPLKTKKSIKLDKAPKTVITHMLIDKELDIGQLCYLYNYDKKFTTFRIDNYINYCKNAKRKGGYPISIEMLIPEGELSEKEISQLALKELKEFGILKKGTKINFIKTEVLGYGFPLFSTNNIKVFDQTRDNIKKLDIKNLTTIGVLSNKDLFFESDIKKDLYLKIKQRY